MYYAGLKVFPDMPVATTGGDNTSSPLFEIIEPPTDMAVSVGGQPIYKDSTGTWQFYEPVIGLNPNYAAPSEPVIDPLFLPNRILAANPISPGADYSNLKFASELNPAVPGPNKTGMSVSFDDILKLTATAFGGLTSLAALQYQKQLVAQSGAQPGQRKAKGKRPVFVPNQILHSSGVSGTPTWLIPLAVIAGVGILAYTRLRRS